jgi:hypothetical protein
MRTKSLRIAAVGFVGLAVATACAPQPARADIVESIVDTDDMNAVVGSITFPGLAGASDAGVLLSFDGFTQADITSISWNLDPATLGVTALDLNALQGTPGCGETASDCFQNTLTLSPSLAARTSIQCNTLSFGIVCFPGNTPDQNIAFVPTPAPESSTWAMMLLGFIGLGCAGYSQRQKLAGASSV